MYDHPYKLEPYKGKKTRYTCPVCEKPNEFTRYIDTQTGEHLNEYVGICNRKSKCAYHYPPKEYFEDNNISSFQPRENKIKKRRKPQLKPKTSYMDNTILQKSKSREYSNYFIDFLESITTKDDAQYLADLYHIGTSKYWPGATVFWQLDIQNKLRTGKIMLYHPTTGKRVKKPYNHINWVHSVLKLKNFTLKQCLFGEHLLNFDKEKPVAIVESEKTAIIAHLALPEFIWLACGSVNNLNEQSTKVLKGRNVFLFPDLGCYDLWKSKIPKLTKLATFRMSDLLERKANEQDRKEGADLADYLIEIYRSLDI